MSTLPAERTWAQAQAPPLAPKGPGAATGPGNKQKGPRAPIPVREPGPRGPGGEVPSCCQSNVTTYPPRSTNAHPGPRSPPSQ